MSLPTMDTDTLAAVAAEHGYELRRPHPSTLRRRRSARRRPFPVISRSDRSYQEPEGRQYGEGVPDQRDADAGYWRAGREVREACEPMTVAVGGTVRRIYDVTGWTQDPNSGKWRASLGAALTDDDLDREHPDYPYRHGDPCPTHRGRAYRPEWY